MGNIVSLLFNREVIAYLIAGVLTTLVNLVIFTVLNRYLGLQRWALSNLPAIVGSIVFAFFINRWFVFCSTAPIIPEMKRFFPSRVLISLIFEYGALYLLVNVLRFERTVRLFGQEILIPKLLSQIFVVVGNYLVSKLFVFV